MGRFPGEGKGHFPTPVFWLENSIDYISTWGRKELDATELLSHHKCTIRGPGRGNSCCERPKAGMSWCGWSHEGGGRCVKPKVWVPDGCLQRTTGSLRAEGLKASEDRRRFPPGVWVPLLARDTRNALSSRNISHQLLSPRRWQTVTQPPCSCRLHNHSTQVQGKQPHARKPKL